MSRNFLQNDLYKVLQDLDDRLTRWDSLLPVEQWTEIGSDGAPAFENSWVNYDSLHNSAAFYKDPFGIVKLKGLVKTGTIGTAIFTLPTNYRPDKYCVYPIIANDAIATLNVLDDGQVVPTTGSNVWLSIDFVSFRADG